MILCCSTLMSDLLSSLDCVLQSSLSTLDQPFAPVALLKCYRPSPNQTGKINLTLQIASTSCGELTPQIHCLAPLKPESSAPRSRLNVYPGGGVRSPLGFREWMPGQSLTFSFIYLSVYLSPSWTDESWELLSCDLALI